MIIKRKESILKYSFILFRVSKVYVNTHAPHTYEFGDMTCDAYLVSTQKDSGDH